MNERIAKLYEQAIIIEDSGDYVCGELDPEKFAELIVRECARVSERTGSLNEADYEGEMISDAIKEHFGVEE